MPYILQTTYDERAMVLGGCRDEPWLASFAVRAAHDLESISSALKAKDEALDYYACSKDCTEVKLKNGECIRASVGSCGAVARAAQSEGRSG